MSMRTCPECGSSVKLENMKRHYSNVHPGKDPSAAISEEEHREVIRATRSRGPPVYTRRSFQVVIALLVIVAVGFVGMPYVLRGLPAGPGFDIVGTCGLEGTVEHYHPLLVINDNGVQKPLPYAQGQGVDVGGLNQPGYTNSAYYCPSGQVHVLHTHDGSGIIHVELPQVVNPAPTLGQFFTIWGEPLTTGTVWTYTGHVSAVVYNSDTATVTDYSSNPTSIPLYEPAGGPTANNFNIPQNYIFNGAYGDGQSGGTFSGEIIWLNVTA